MPLRTLIAYYPASKDSHGIVHAICASLGPGTDLQPLVEPRARATVTGVLRAIVDTLSRHKPAPARLHHDPARYDVLILGGPARGRRMAAPVRRYARRHGASARHVAFVHMGCGHHADDAFFELEEYCGQVPCATLVVGQGHAKPPADRDALARFTEEIRKATY